MYTDYILMSMTNMLMQYNASVLTEYSFHTFPPKRERLILRTVFFSVKNHYS